jgi:hypothetical protein
MGSTVNREAIWVALFALLQAQLANAGFVTMSRTHVQPPVLTADQQPALFVVQGRETKAPRPQGFPGKITLAGFLIIYFQTPVPMTDPTGQETVNGATQLNAMLQAIDSALEPDDIPKGTLTLGGLVTHCWIEGDTDMDTGIYTQQGAAIIPIRIMVP